MKQNELILELEGKASEDAYEGNTYDIDVSVFEKVVIHIFEIGASNGITYSIDTSLKGLRWRNVASAAIAASGNAGEALTDPVERIRIQIKSTVGGNAGKFNLYVRGLPA